MAEPISVQLVSDAAAALGKAAQAVDQRATDAAQAASPPPPPERPNPGPARPPHDREAE